MCLRANFTPGMDPFQIYTVKTEVVTIMNPWSADKACLTDSLLACLPNAHIKMIVIASPSKTHYIPVHVYWLIRVSRAIISSKFHSKYQEVWLQMVSRSMLRLHSSTIRAGEYLKFCQMCGCDMKTLWGEHYW